MSLTGLVSSILIFILWSNIGFSYHIQHNGRIINDSDTPILIYYQLCEYKKTMGLYQLTCNESSSMSLEPISASGELFEHNLDIFDNKNVDSKNRYILYHMYSIYKITAGNISTYFDSLIKPSDDDPLSPHGTQCTIMLPLSVVVIRLKNNRFYCYS